MQIIRHRDVLKTSLAALRARGDRIALVPTMGALHRGHMQLVHTAFDHADHVVVSIFVNPAQFGPNEDLDAYPRQEKADAALLEKAGVALLWVPGTDEMYPAGYATSVTVSGVSDGLCGAARPGHFDGVATVVAKLFNQVRPDVALFGEKDYQQLAVIRRMARDLDFTHDIIGVPTVRDADGLALSSRNAYLSSAERVAAGSFPAALQAAVERLQNGDSPHYVLDDARQQILGAGFAAVDYVELRNADTLAQMQDLDRPARLLAAARIGSTRLIDNMPVKPR